MHSKLIDLFDEFIKGYDEKAKNPIWEEKGERFTTFWQKRIVAKGSPRLTDHEMDDIIRILDRNARGNANVVEVVTRAMIPQNKWYKLFSDIKSNKSHHELISRIMAEKNEIVKAELLDKLKERNKGFNNCLTGAYANGINTILAIHDMFGTLSIVSLNDRLSIMKFLGYTDVDDFEGLSWGNKIVKSGKYILDECRKAGIIANARTISVFFYSAMVKPLWKLDAEDAIDANDMEEPETPYRKQSNSQRFWLYAPGQGANMWERFYENGIMCLGWSELGDLRNYKDKESIQMELQQINPKDSSQNNSALANFEFCHVLKPGDVVIAKKGVSTYIGYGIVSSDYFYDSSKDDFRSIRRIHWKKKGNWEEPDHRLVMKTLTDITKYPDYVEKLKRLIGIDDLTYLPNESRTHHFQNNQMLNTILYGPPGTGKTYSTIQRALECLGDNAAGRDDRPLQHERFDRYVQQGRIAFTTFHQSMSYEDFIEGIKPNSDAASGAIQYHVADGVFKQCCARAAYLCHLAHIELKGEKKPYTFDELYEAFTDDLQQQLDKGIYPMFKSKTGKDTTVREIKASGSIIARAANSVAKSSAPLTKENIQKLYDRFHTTEEITHLDMVRETVEVTPRISEFYAIFKGFKEFEQRFAREYDTNADDIIAAELPIEQVCKNFNEGVYTKAVLAQGDNAPPVVIIIDEINRGNISQIFGELITLIETDKRLGRKEGLEIVLPYSKRRFGVPPNLYIIGTMNTADRSVEALDTALRRRFSFTEMPPRYDFDALKREEYGVNLAALLKTINTRIEKLLDRDHLIGHSYFLDDGIDLKATFQHKIIPLLQEYFFGDYGKIGLVLGRGFVQIEVVQHGKGIFAAFDYDDVQELSERRVYQLCWPEQMSTATFEEALVQLMNV